MTHCQPPKSVLSRRTPAAVDSDTVEFLFALYYGSFIDAVEMAAEHEWAAALLVDRTAGPVEDTLVPADDAALHAVPAGWQIA